MKKSYLFICAFAAAILLAGCQKELNNEEVELVEATHSVVFTAEKMVDTKTAIASEENGVVSYKWLEGDIARMRITESYQYEEENTETGEMKTKTKTTVGTITSMNITNEGKKATFNVTFSGTAPDAEVTYLASYAGSHSSNGNPLIPAAQSPLADTFDPAADVLVSAPIKKDARDTEHNEFIFDMTRKVSVNKMTLKGLEEGEVISSVTFESDKQHSAYYLGNDDYSANGKKLTFTFSANNTVPANGEFPVYFTTAPVENATFTVSVTTDKNKYRKTSAKTISFACGQVRRFGVDLSGYEVPEGRTFTLVKDVDDLVIGSDIVIATDGTTDLAMSTTQNNNNRGSTEAATKSADQSTIEVGDDVQIFTLEAGTETNTYAFLCSNGDQAGKYIYAVSSSNNYLRSQNNLDANASWAISISNKEATVTTTVTTTVSGQETSISKYLKYNSGSSVFSCYASGQQPVYLYQAAGLPAANLSFAESSYTFTLGDADYTAFTGQTLTNPNNISDITWTSSNTNLATVSDGIITWIPDATGTTTITATFAGDDFFKAGSDSYTITVNPAPTVLTLPFIETFSNCGGTMGWSGSGVATGDFVPDYEDWFVANASGADGAAKFGTRTALGSAETPEINYSGNATLTFKAGAWDGGSENTNLILSLSSGTLYSDANLTNAITSVTMTKGAWTTYTVYLKGLTSPFTLTFEGNSANNSRFFLDDVKIVEGIVVPEVEPEQLVMSNISCTNSGVSETSLNFSWSAVANATGYKVSTDGTTFVDTQSATTYTLTGLEAGTAYTIWVKAIGDGTNYTDSAAKQSASGTTKTSSGTGYTLVSPETITFSDRGYSNGDEISSVAGTNWSMSFDKGTNSNAPKYYTTGDAIRCYGGNTFTVTVASGYKIESITLTFSSGEGSNAITTSTGTYNNNSWSGNIENGGSVVFTVSGTSGHRRIAAIKIN